MIVKFLKYFFKVLFLLKLGIELQQYDDRWQNEFMAIKQVILHSLNDIVLGIEHIGSTAVKGLAAKPILDMELTCNKGEHYVNKTTTSRYKKITNRV
ncbi:GrpB family protein [Fictibacillus nanhaiensis]|uniref:GrpB family protein n=1 Tax=Fictibacillus nanhaiensis TaxID=742169 RepID=A0ABS2ZWQ7_9BACL|nr:GrpB family protein [Fictibacillus nanhaiensis]